MQVITKIDLIIFNDIKAYNNLDGTNKTPVFSQDNRKLLQQGTSILMSTRKTAKMRRLPYPTARRHRSDAHRSPRWPLGQ